MSSLLLLLRAHILYYTCWVHGPNNFVALVFFETLDCYSCHIISYLLQSRLRHHLSSTLQVLFCTQNTLFVSFVLHLNLGWPTLLSSASLQACRTLKRTHVIPLHHEFEEFPLFISTLVTDTADACCNLHQPPWSTLPDALSFRR
jgi:hypothetical protein